MEAFQDFPEIFDKAIFHESPINVFLPKNDKQQVQQNHQDIVKSANGGNLMTNHTNVFKNTNYLKKYDGLFANLNK
ncbi:hypothetical protein [Weissella coleopterorum]|uniref:hypothetical protein n=1 Tax=Weissella coleopterorum TaxID=2714949 RepID=UPI00197F4FC6|nr:hypothetical protein [Weissella coleopterorum]